MATKQKLLGAAAGFGTDDPDFKYTTLLLDFDGTSGDANNTFTDSSTNALTITENGSVVQGSFSPYGDNWSVYFENDTAIMQTDTGINVGTSNFTIEMWVWVTENDVRFCAQNNTGGTNFALKTNTSGYLGWDVPTGTDINSTLASGGIMDYVLPLNQWVHVAAVREGTGSNQFKMYADGVLVAQGRDNSSHGTGRKINIAGGRGNSANYDGYISNFRFVVGSAVYTSAFTPPTAPLTNITNTKLLACQSNRFLDNSSTGDTFTLDIDTGYPKVTRFSPFERGEDRTLTADGGSAYFDGVKTTQLYAGTSNVIPATGDFTIEGWVYFTGLNTVNSRSVFFVKDSGTTVSGNRSFQAIFNNNGTKYDDLSIALFQSNSSYDVSVFTHTFEFNEWYHVAVTRTGQTIECFVNGTSIGTDTNTRTSINQTTEENYIGSWNSSNKDDTHVGYFGDFRIVHSRVYTSNFTPPTSPLTAISNTELLLNFQDAGIFDRSGINNIDTVGNARLGFAPIYGTGSIEFDGTNDELLIPEHASTLTFGTGDFTVETWAYFDALSGTRVLVDWRNGTGNQGAYPTLYFSGTTLYFYNGSNQLSATLATSQWYHIALTRENGSTRLFIDGTQAGSAYADTTNYLGPQDGFLTIGGLNQSFEMDGYIDDFRITKGVARYTSAFTPPDEIDLSTDTHAEYVTLFLDGDGTVNGQNNTFTDSGSVGATITKNGDAIQGVSSPYGDNWSNNFDESSSLSVTDLTAPGTTFTVEFWVYFNDPSNDGLFQFTDTLGAGTTTDRPGLFLDSTGQLKAYANGGNQGTGTTLVAGQWYHIAMVRASSTVNVYVDGTSVWNASETEDFSTHNDLNIGKLYSTGYLLDGYLSNFRYVSGTAVYTANFTPPTAPLTAITNTELLTCQSNRFIDNSSNSYTVAVQEGTPKVTRFSPFESNKPYDITTDGGSVLFGPSGDYLQLPSNSAYNATSSLCVECWFYMVGAPGAGSSAHCPLSRWASTTAGQRAWFFDIENTGVRMRVDTATNSANVVVVDNSTGALNRYAWYHIALTWDGSTYRGFLNGELIGSLSDSNAPRGTSQVIRVGYNLNTHYMDGYVSDCRVLVDQGPVYISAFTPPTAPLGNLTGTANTLNYVVYENKSFDVSSQETNPQGVRFKSDGTKMYVVGNTGDDVGQYSLSTAWDVSTASFDSVTLDVSSEDSIPNGLVFSSDGTKLYITGNTNNKIFQYDLSTAWDLSTASYASKSLSVQGSSPIEPFIHPSGTSIYNIDSDSETVYQYTMTTPFDLSTASYASKSVNVNSQESIPTSLVFSSDGTKMFVAGQSGDDINQYTLSTAWDVSTASFDNLVFDSSSQAANPAGIDLKSDGTKLYMISNSSDTVYQYSLTSSTTPPVLLNFQDSAIPDLSGLNNIDTVGNAKVAGSAQTKYGSNSLQLNGTSGYLLLEENMDASEFGSGDFTIEFWLYTNDATANQTLIDFRPASTSGLYPLIYIPSGATEDIRYRVNGVDRITSSTISSNAWMHVAVARSGSSTKLFINGTQQGSTYTDSNDYALPSRVVIGAGSFNLGGAPLDGFMDDLRITKGVARYTANFTPPIKALPKH